MSSVSKMWGGFQERVEQTRKTMPKLTAEQAATRTCLLCRHGEFGPGCKGAKGACPSRRQSKPTAVEEFSRPFLCFFCNSPIGHEQSYYRFDDPRRRFRQDNKTVMSVCLHADGAKCVGKKQPDGSDFGCADCGESTGDVRDVMGAGQEAHMFCTDCKFEFDKRADLLAEVQAQIEKERIARRR